MPADIVIRNATIVDGTGAPGFAGAVAVQDGRITSVGSAEAGTTEIDGTGLTLSPGFVDVHSHDDAAFVQHPGMEFKLAQGVTTEVSGNCGFSAVPNDPEKGPPPGVAIAFRGPWRDLTEYGETIEEAGAAINNAMLVGHNAVRGFVMGMEQRPPTAEELSEMRRHVREAMEQGAVGFSTGLIYEPGRYSQTEEVVALASEAAALGGLYATHMRNEGDQLLEAVGETLHIGTEAGLPVHISHHKSAGPGNWGRIGESLAKVEAAVEAGQQVTLDVYPYNAGSGPMHQYFDLDDISLELANAIRIANCPDFPQYEGRMLPEISESEGINLSNAVRRVTTGPRGAETICIQFIIGKEDIETNLRHPLMMVGSDGIPNLNGMPHPRLFGTFPRVLAMYVRDRGVASIEEAVRRMTSFPCDTFGLAGRGRISEGMWADLVLFDPATVQDLATYDDPKREPAGISAVIVNGQIACRDGVHTGAGAGRFLRRGQET